MEISQNNALAISLELDRSESSTDGVVKKCVDSFQRVIVLADVYSNQYDNGSTLA